MNLDRLRLLVLAVLALAGCTPSIGDKCVLSTDCSIRGDRLCDTSQPDGYCTIFNCQGNLCPNNAACVQFYSSVPGCGFNDRNTPSRTGQTFCMAQCNGNSDCRTGYVCADPRQQPWNALILDDNQAELVCIVPPDSNGATNASVPDAAVCQANGPMVPPIDATPPMMTPMDASHEASVMDSSAQDTGAPESGVDAAADASDAAGDVADAGAPDAPDAGG